MQLPTPLVPSSLPTTWGIGEGGGVVNWLKFVSRTRHPAIRLGS